MTRLSLPRLQIRAKRSGTAYEPAVSPPYPRMGSDWQDWPRVMARGGFYPRSPTGGDDF
ncbi:hypothetical protein [Acetobacter sp.]|uniref:hypothetical protein n=1 Tax=Acetobacter sp. TaxID=440 RepID=UPI00258AD1D7|nr:hypothetical protein [Acetobacter sp.]MCC6106109.1 hypothetical protein [Acetobacter sp.]